MRAVEPADWLWLPPGGARPIAEIVARVGACKYMYDRWAYRGVGEAQTPS